MQSLLALMQNPDVQKLVGTAGGVGTALGFVVKWLLPKIQRLTKTEHQIAEEALQRALATPGTADDDAAREHLAWVLRIESLVADAKADAEVTPAPPVTRPVADPKAGPPATPAV